MFSLAVDGTHSSFLHQVGDHDDDLGVLLPHHPPKVLKSGFEGTLSGNVSFGLVVALRDEIRHVSNNKSNESKCKLHANDCTFTCMS